jgi:hypothetical protein
MRVNCLNNSRVFDHKCHENSKIKHRKRTHLHWFCSYLYSTIITIIFSFLIKDHNSSFNDESCYDGLIAFWRSVLVFASVTCGLLLMLVVRLSSRIVLSEAIAFITIPLAISLPYYSFASRETVVTYDHNAELYGLVLGGLGVFWIKCPWLFILFKIRSDGGTPSVRRTTTIDVSSKDNL